MEQSGIPHNYFMIYKIIWRMCILQKLAQRWEETNKWDYNGYHKLKNTNWVYNSIY